MSLLILTLFVASVVADFDFLDVSLKTRHSNFCTEVFSFSRIILKMFFKGPFKLGECHIISLNITCFLVIRNIMLVDEMSAHLPLTCENW